MNKYIFDTNVLVDSYSKYYRIQNFPTFWDKYLLYILDKSNDCCFIDKVYEEINHFGNKDLYDWVKSNNIPIVSTNNKIIIDEYLNVFNKIKSINAYTDSSIANWDNDYVADPWLIAVAINKKYTIVTSEVPATANSQHKKLKIPDVAKEFDIECISMQRFITMENFVI